MSLKKGTIDIGTIIKTPKYKPEFISFYNYTGNSLTNALSNLDTSNMTSMSNMFNSCGSLTSLDLSSFDTSNVTNMSHMFDYCSGLTSLDLSSFDTSNVTNMSYMFEYCNKLETLIINKNSILPLKTAVFSVFSNCPIYTSTTEGFVYVPDDLVDSYKSATNWSSIANKIKGLSELPQ